MTSPAVRDLVAEQLRRELAVRLTHGNDAVLRRVPDLYRRIIGEALLAEQGATGAGAQMRAAQRALDRAARIGVADFVDTAGRRWDWQSYAEMAVRTAAMRARNDAQLAVYRSRGVRLVHVSDHAGACPLCAPWDGEILAIDDLPDGEIVDGQGKPIRVAGALADATSAGLFHPSCRHRLSAVIPGRTILPPPSPPDPEVYLAQQRQRALERQVRYWRRREAAAATGDAKAYTRGKVEGWQQAAREHAAANPVRRLYGREQPDTALPSPTPRRAPGLPDTSDAPPAVQTGRLDWQQWMLGR